MLSDTTPTVRIGSHAMTFGPPIVMGVINVTPDSFSGDGLHLDSNMAFRKGVEMMSMGATLLDIGGESTRPDAEEVSLGEELRRTTGVIEALSQSYPGRVSIDTMKPEVAEAALKAGASIVNDVSGLRNRRMIEVVASNDAAVVIMHMKGDPRTMQKSPQYEDVVAEIIDYLNDRVAEAEAEGVSSDRIMVDPGIGFGKTVDHNIEILSRLREFRSLGKPVVIGVSRKSFIGAISPSTVEDRLGGSVAAATIAAIHSANIVRAHDVGETVQALMVAWKVHSKSGR